MPTEMNWELKRHMDEKRAKESVRESIKTLADVVNREHSEFLADAMFEAMISQHRTLQQDTFRALYLMMVRYSKEALTDLRNDDSKVFCEQVANLDTGFRRV